MTPTDIIQSPRSLKSKLLVPLLLAGIAIAALAVWGIQRTSRQQLELHLQHRAELIAHLVNYAAESVSRAGELQRIVAAVGAESDVLGIVVVGGEPARVLASTKVGWFKKLLADLPTEEIADDLEEAIRNNASYHHFNAGGDRYVVSSPLLLSEQELSGNTWSTGAVMVHMDTRPMQAAIWKSIREFSAIFLAGSLFLGMLGYGLIHRRVLRPLAAIGAAVSAGPSSTLKIWENATTDDELGALAHTLLDALARTDAALSNLKADIAARNVVEEQLRQSEERREMALSSAELGLWDWNVASGETVFDQRWCEMLGYAAHELEQTVDTWVSLMNPEDTAPTHVILDGHLRGETPIYQTEFRMRHREGHWVWIQGRGKVVERDAAGAPLRMTGTHMDFTARKNAEAALAETLAWQKTLMENAGSAIIATAPDGTVQTFNPAAEKMLGYAGEEIVGKQTPALWHDRVEVAERARLLSEELGERVEPGFDVFVAKSLRGMPNENEWIYIRKDGTRFPVTLTVTALTDAAGNNTGFIGLAQDITQRKQSEAELAEAHQELIKTSRLAGMAEVATGVLHNVGNVLNSVNVSANLLADRIRKTPVADLGRVVALLRDQGAQLGSFFTSDPRGPKMPEYLAQLADRFTRQQEKQFQEVAALQKNVEHIKEIVAMQQSYAKVSGLSESLSPAELIEDALRMNAGLFQKHEIELVRDVPADLPPMCVDKHKVLQILINFLRNARHACDEAGHPEKRITVRATSASSRVRITIADNGVGIPPENLNRVFNHGFTTKKTGHGFGLHSAANAAREMGGNVTVESDGPGRGAAFTLELPAGSCRLVRSTGLPHRTRSRNSPAEISNPVLQV